MYESSVIKTIMFVNHNPHVPGYNSKLLYQHALSLNVIMVYIPSLTINVIRLKNVSKLGNELTYRNDQTKIAHHILIKNVTQIKGGRHILNFGSRNKILGN